MSSLDKDCGFGYRVNVLLPGSAPGYVDHSRMMACSCTIGRSALRVVQAALNRVMPCRKVACEVA